MEEQLRAIRRQRQQEYEEKTRASLPPPPPPPQAAPGPVEYPTLPLAPPAPLVLALPPGRVSRLRPNRMAPPVSTLWAHLCELIRQDRAFFPDDDEAEYERNLRLEDVPTPVPSNLLTQLPEVPYRETSDEAYRSCSVCLMDYEPQEQVLILPCFHRFHPACIKAWFEHKSTCPVCKLDVRKAVTAPL